MGGYPRAQSALWSGSPTKTLVRILTKPILIGIILFSYGTVVAQVPVGSITGQLRGLTS